MDKDATASDKAGSLRRGVDGRKDDGEEVGAALNAQLRDAMEMPPPPPPAATMGDEDNDEDDDLGEGTSASASASAHDDEIATENGDDEEEDEEPTLRYSRIQSQPVTELFSRGDTCSALAVSDKYLVLGTHNGGVVILLRPGQQHGDAAVPSGHTKGPSGYDSKRSSMVDADQQNEELEGQKVLKRYRPHQASVMAIVIDEESQFIGTASTDGEPYAVWPSYLLIYLMLSSMYRQGGHSECGELGCPALRSRQTVALSHPRAGLCFKIYQAICVRRPVWQSYVAREGLVGPERCGTTLRRRTYLGCSVAPLIHSLGE